MTARTKGWAFVCALVVALTLPAEGILLRALQTPSAQDAVRAWAADLPSKELYVAADRIEAYPFAYRKEIMRALSASGRAVVWRRHIGRYITNHPSLDGNALVVLQAAQAAITPDLFQNPTDAARASVHALGEQAVAVLGRDEAENLLYRLGPRDGTFASIEPLNMRLANKVRGMFAALATWHDCDCSSRFGCDYGMLCLTDYGCNIDIGWPMCGWFFTEFCDGICGSN